MSLDPYSICRVLETNAGVFCADGPSVRSYSVETNRAGIDESISEFDLHDTYLPQYVPVETRTGCVPNALSELEDFN